MTDATDAVLDSVAVDRAAELIAQATNIVVLSGAGISAESGIPTFREAQTGLWARFSPADLASPEAFARDPARVWAWYHWRRTLIARGGPNAGHHALVSLAATQHLHIITQNVDGLHQAAGSASVTELHGNIWRERCSNCAHRRTARIAEAQGDAPVRCADCGDLMRPDIVWFGEHLPTRALATAEQAVADADCVLVIGTSNQVYPAAAFVDTVVAGKATVIEINPARTPVSGDVDCCLRVSASLALPAIVAALDAGQPSR
ncbi:NAD-dependent deacylase [Salinisphaera sp. Q1T1-3]|uniref:SIR2 family NAD-dependent protein deacylase n=1 Tax=Salinisphaera sp. Q1T1-3 TaxID=2321229 RepID=UPI000E70A6D1|nr:NAD-dependent deacylase [Salinisphaera sp. Q1T1-3]RJS95062.1 NAD-dependent deacylase [Salinisphaera sp. Q1T1-3]